ncbi:MAG: hypothetical protein JO055_10100 [Alphaproteobacteria bacterium]|nr:hypothetical protein [Alphaproteobacteria bacterium]
MVLSKTGSGSVRPYIPGKGAWGTLVSALALVTCLTFGGADRTHHAPAAAQIDAGDIDHIPVLNSEIHYAGA